MQAATQLADTSKASITAQVCLKLGEWPGVWASQLACLGGACFTAAASLLQLAQVVSFLCKVHPTASTWLPRVCVLAFAFRSSRQTEEGCQVAGAGRHLRRSHVKLVAGKEAGSKSHAVGQGCVSAAQQASLY